MTKELTETGSAPVNLPVEQRAEAAIAAQGALTLEQLQGEMQKYENLLQLEVTDKESDGAVHAAYMTVKELRVDINRKGKAAREDAVALQKAVVSVEKQLIEVVKPVEDALKTNRDTYRDEQKRLREKAKARNSNIEAAISFYTNYPSGFFNASASELAVAIEQLKANDDDHIKTHFSQWDNDKVQGQGVESAIEQRDLALTSLHQAHEKAVAAEAAQAELADLRAQKHISEKVNTGMVGGLAEVNAAINMVAAFGKDYDVTAQLTQLGQRKADLEAAAEAKAEQETQIRRTQEAESARMKAETDAANTKAQAAKDEADRLKQEKADQIAAEEKKQREIKEEEARKAEEAAETARQEALRPDKEKLNVFLDQLMGFVESNVPAMESDDANKLGVWVMTNTQNLVNAAKAKAGEL